MGSSQEQARPPEGDALRVLVLSLLTFAVLVLAVLSLRWEIHWDAAEWHYQAFLINEKGFTPYRDVFDVNMFGTVFLHVGASRLFGYSDVGMRCFDLLWLAGLCACTYGILRPVDWRAAWAGSVAFAWLYLAQGETQHFQRDYLKLLPVSAAVLLAVSPSGSEKPRLRSLLIGLLFGLAATLKPQVVLALPLVAMFSLTEPTWKQKLAAVAWAGVGCVIPLAAGFLWLWAIGALPAFVDVVTNYWPVYTRFIFDGSIQTVDAAERRRFVWEAAIHWRNFPVSKLLIFSPLVAVVVYWSPGLTRVQRGITLLLGALALVYYLEVVLVGAFHPYSWLPLVYFLVLLTALGFCRPALTHGSWLGPALFPIAAGTLLWACGSRVPENAVRQLQGLPPQTLWTERSAEIAAFLSDHLQPGDRVQSLDYLGGVSRAFLLAGAAPATRITMDGYFNFETQTPAVQELRRQFLETLRATLPRFFVVTTRIRLFAEDRRDPGEFQRTIDQFLALHYRRVKEGDGYVIYERLSER